MAANFHLGNAEFPLLVARIGRSFNGTVLAVEEPESGNAVVFARKDCVLTSRELEEVVRPETLETAQWNRLQASFARIRTALQERGA